MSGQIINLTPEDVASNGQPVLLYNAYCKGWLFVNNDKLGYSDAAIVESHGDKNDYRNQFVLQTVDNGKYRIYNPKYNHWMFITEGSLNITPEHFVGSHIYSHVERNYFTFEEAGNNQYFIYNPSCSEYIFVSDVEWTFNNVVGSHPNKNEERNKFTIQLLHADIEVVDIQYDIDKATTQESTPVVLSSMTINNDSGTEQTTAFHLDERVQETSNFQHTTGSSVTVGTSFQTGIPIIAEGEIRVDVTEKYEYTWGESTTKIQNFKSVFTLNCEPHKKTTGEAIVQKMILDVPYKMTLKTKEGRLFYSYGNWNGVSHWNLEFTVKSEPL